MPWNLLYSTTFERMEAQQAPGGYLYRLTSRATEDASAEQICLCFVPGEQFAPVNVDVPAVLVNGDLAGNAKVGDTLTCTTGNWDEQPTRYSFHWRSDGDPVGSDSDTYVAAAEQGETAIDCIVTAYNAAGEAAAPPSNAVEIDA